jgi:hypothetical protein
VKRTDADERGQLVLSTFIFALVRGFVVLRQVRIRLMGEASNAPSFMQWFETHKLENLTQITFVAL